MKMKQIIYILGIVLLLGSVVSCEKESEGLSRVTHYVDINLEGPATVTVPVGTEYNEPGYTAVEGETDVTDQVETADNINNSQIGVYNVTYTAVNQDGFPSSKSRTVVVYDPAAPDVDLSGTYTTTIVRTESDGSNPREYHAQMTLAKQGTGVFYVSCLLGGTYSVGWGYGPAYAMTGYVNLNSDYSFSLITSFIQGWGDSLEGYQNGKYLQDSGDVYWESIYAGGDIYAVTGVK